MPIEIEIRRRKWIWIGHILCRIHGPDEPGEKSLLLPTIEVDGENLLKVYVPRESIILILIITFCQCTVFSRYLLHELFLRRLYRSCLKYINAGAFK